MSNYPAADDLHTQLDGLGEAIKERMEERAEMLVLLRDLADQPYGGDSLSMPMSEIMLRHEKMAACLKRVVPATHALLARIDGDKRSTP